VQLAAQTEAERGAFVAAMERLVPRAVKAAARSLAFSTAPSLAGRDFAAPE